MASEAIAEIEELIKVEEVGEGDLQAVAVAKPPCFLPWNSIPSLEIPTGARSPYAHLFPPQVVNNAHSLLAQVSPPPAMIFPGGRNAFPGGTNNSTVTAEDGGLDLTLRL
nr:zinc finger protein STAMENLESS 1-like [Ipomoea trifida]